MLRLPGRMREAVRASADANGRSMNAEIVHALQAYLAGAEGGAVSDDLAQIEAALLAAKRLAERLRKG